MDDVPGRCTQCGEPAEPPPAPGESEAATILVLGILGWVSCGVLGVFAWVKGNRYLRRCRDAEVPPAGIATAGRLLGILSTLLMLAKVSGLIALGTLMVSRGRVTIS